MFHRQRWSFSSSFSPVDRWSFEDGQHMADHMKTCRYYIKWVLSVCPFFFKSYLTPSFSSCEPSRELAGPRPFPTCRSECNCPPTATTESTPIKTNPRNRLTNFYSFDLLMEGEQKERERERERDTYMQRERETRYFWSHRKDIYVSWVVSNAQVLLK